MSWILLRSFCGRRGCRTAGRRLFRRRPGSAPVGGKYRLGRCRILESELLERYGVMLHISGDMEAPGCTIPGNAAFPAPSAPDPTPSRVRQSGGRRRQPERRNPPSPRPCRMPRRAGVTLLNAPAAARCRRSMARSWSDIPAIIARLRRTGRDLADLREGTGWHGRGGALPGRGRAGARRHRRLLPGARACASPSPRASTSG